jgi:hypothetical protein
MSTQAEGTNRGAVTRNVRRTFAVVMLSAVVLVGAVAPVSATGSESEQGTATWCLDRIDRRVGDIGRLLTKVANAYDVTPAHRASLTTALQDAIAGLLDLRRRSSSSAHHYDDVQREIRW